MAQFKFRQLERLEARENPVGNWAAGIGNASANEGMLRAVSSYIIGTGQENSFNVVMPDAIISQMRTIVDDSNAAEVELAKLRDNMNAQLAGNPGLWETMAEPMRYVGGLLFQVQANEIIATRIGNLIGTDFSPPPVTPPPTPPRADAGMTNVLPNVNAPQWQDQGNGLKIWDIKTGTGPIVAAGSNIKIFYTGWLLNGTIFDSRRSPQAPIDFDLDGLIQGWQQGIPGMRAGGIRRLYIPSALAYGANGSPPSVPPNSDLVFEIKMISSSP